MSEGKLEQLRLAACMPHLTERMRSTAPQEDMFEQRGELGQLRLAACMPHLTKRIISTASQETMLEWRGSY